jgi:hypothetical protein
MSGAGARARAAVAPRGGPTDGAAAPPARVVRLPTALAIAGLAALLGGGGATLWTERRLAAELVMRPPVVVVDYAPITDALGRGADPRALEAAFGSVKANVARFERAGYLVVNRVALETFPAGLAIPVPPLPVAAARAPGSAPPLAAAVPLGSGVPGFGAAPLALDMRPAPPAAAPPMSEGEAGALLRALLGGAGAPR